MEAKTVHTNKQETFNFFRTASHGYLEIDINLHPEALDVISEYSLMSADCTKIYAEQDRDAAKVMELLNIKAEQINVIKGEYMDILKNTFRLDGSVNNFGFSILI